MVRLVALDIDGTLLTPGVAPDALPDTRVINAVNNLHSAGIRVVLATGRMFPGSGYVARHLGISEPVICQQGASIHNVDGSLRHGYQIDPDIALELLAYADAHNWPLSWFDSERYLVTRPSPAADYFAAVSRIDVEINSRPQSSGVQATGIDIISTAEDAPAVHTMLEARYGAAITLLDFTSVTAVHAPEASKGNALRSLAAEWGISREDVLAIGDSVNDVSMLSWAGASAAPAHSDRYALEAAQEILPGDGIDGVIARLTALTEP